MRLFIHFEREGVLGFIFLFLIFFCTACQPKVKEKPDLAFYHWQSNFELTKLEEDYIRGINLDKIYLRFFDVAWNGQKNEAVPLGILNVKKQSPLPIIPTIFITNETMLKTPLEAVEKLANQITKKIKELSNQFELPKFQEIQIDCDWSKRTRESYFTLLKILRQHFEKRGVQISTTIRLHQIKFYKETGVPPVDKGMLMCYNTGNLEDITTANSILDLETAQKYFVNFENYPLKLDLALPIFAWTVVYRNGAFIKLINNLRKEILEQDDRLVKIKPNQYQLNKSTYIEGYYLYKGDVLRTEAIDEALLLDLSKKLSKYFNETQKFTLSFYHLDSLTINHFSKEQVQHVYEQFME